jgi:hypothetical protein
LNAAPAEKERALISTRTRQALLAAKSRGVTLGNPRLHLARKIAVEAVKSDADRYAANVVPIIREAQKAGARTLREIAEALNARGGIATARGGLYAQSIANILERAEEQTGLPRTVSCRALRHCLFALRPSSGETSRAGRPWLQNSRLHWRALAELKRAARVF